MLPHSDLAVRGFGNPTALLLVSAGPAGLDVVLTQPPSGQAALLKEAKGTVGAWAQGTDRAAARGAPAEARGVGCASRGVLAPPLLPCRLQGGGRAQGLGAVRRGAGGRAGPHLCSELPSPAPCAAHPSAGTSRPAAAPRPPGTPQGWGPAGATRSAGGRRAWRGPRCSEPSRTAGQGGLQPQGVCGVLGIGGAGYGVLGMGGTRHGVLGMGAGYGALGMGGVGTGHWARGHKGMGSSQHQERG